MAKIYPNEVYTIGEAEDLLKVSNSTITHFFEKRAASIASVRKFFRGGYVTEKIIGLLLAKTGQIYRGNSDISRE